MRSPLVHIMAWCCQATNHYLSQCRPNLFYHMLSLGLNEVISLITRHLFQYKDVTYQYRKSHHGDKTVTMSSYLHNGNSYTGKTASLYWIRPQVAYKYIWQHFSLPKSCPISGEGTWILICLLIYSQIAAVTCNMLVVVVFVNKWWLISPVVIY